MIKTVYGNILDATEDIICHQVNCQGVMGAGVAKALYQRWPIVKGAYQRFCQVESLGEPQNLLGKVQMLKLSQVSMSQMSSVSLTMAAIHTKSILITLL